MEAGLDNVNWIHLALSLRQVVLYNFHSNLLSQCPFFSFCVSTVGILMFPINTFTFVHFSIFQQYYVQHPSNSSFS
jgi:hypothetical protein